MATIGQVAARARVSRATVSRVVNNPDAVGEETRLRVEKAIQALSYTPNRKAQELSLGLNNVVGIVTPRTYSVETAAVASQLSQRGLDISILDAGDSASTASVGELLRRVGGVVVDRGLDTGLLAEIEASDVPVVGMGGETGPIPRVVVDYRPALALAARQLADVGHQSACLFDDGLLPNREAAEMRWIFADHGLKLVRPSRQMNALAKALDGRRRPTAVIASDPLIALRVYNQGRALGHLIPHDLSIISIGSVPATQAMRMTSIDPLVDLVAQCVADLMSTALAEQRPIAGVEMRIEAPFVPGVTSRRAG